MNLVLTLPILLIFVVYATMCTNMCKKGLQTSSMILIQMLLLIGDGDFMIFLWLLILQGFFKAANRRRTFYVSLVVLSWRDDHFTKYSYSSSLHLRSSQIIYESSNKSF